MVDLVNRMISFSMEIVWRQCGEKYFLWGFYSKISRKIVWGFNLENVVNKVPSNLHKK